MADQTILYVWLSERHENAIRIAATKSGANRDGWLEDANYFRRAMDAVQGLQNIANADPSKWEPDMRDQFQQWAQSLARAALSKAGVRHDAAG